MTLSPQVDQHLRRTADLWRRQLLIRRLAMLGVVAFAVFLVIGIAMQFGWFQGVALPALLLVITALGSLLAALITVILTVEKQPDQEFLASTVEKAQQPLQDRLNTLVHLQYQKDDVAKAIRPAIENQTVAVLEHEREAWPFPWLQTVTRLVMLGVLFVATALFYGYFQPWRQLTTQAAEADPTLEIPPTDPTRAEDEPNPLELEAWTEVRISEPGRDLHVTQHEVVPLTIEAASNRHLERVEWFSAVNGQAEQQHTIPTPEDPRYVVHQTELMLEDLQLEPWDVLAYFARATTADGKQHDSEMYFIDLLPGHAQLDELPGGEEGTAYESMRELTSMIQRQQEVLRQTQQASHRATNAQTSDSSIRHLDALAQEELQLRQDIEYVMAALRSRLGSAALEGLEQPSADATVELDAAEQLLRERSAAEAVPHERGGLANLIAMRKQLQQLVQDHPDLFRPQPLELATADPEGPSLDAEQWNEWAKQAAGQREALSAASEALQKLVGQQRHVEQQAAARPPSEYGDVGKQQRQLQQAFADTAQQHSPAIQHAASAAESAGNALEQAANALQERDANAPEKTRQAREELEQLAHSLENKKEEFELAESLALEQRLRRNIQQYEDMVREPAKSPQAEIEKSASETKDIVKSLEDFAARQAGEPSPTDKLSSPAKSTQLEQQLAPERIADINKKCDQLRQPAGQNGRRELASAVKRHLEDFANALAADNREHTQQLLAEQESAETQQMQASHEQLQKARQFVQETLLRERNIERAANQRNRPDGLVQRQLNLQQSLEDFIKDNPPPFQQLSGECNKATTSMRDVAQSLQSRGGNARQRAQEAADALQQLDNGLERQQQQNSMADAHRLQEMLDQQAQQLKQIESQPESVRPSQCQSAGGQCKSTTGQLQQLANRPGTAEGLRKQLQQALNDATKERIDAESDRLAESQNAGQMQSAAKQLRQSLEEVANKLGKGLAGRGQKSGQGLRPGGQEAIEQGLRQLDSVARRQANQRLPAETQSQLHNEALRNLSEGITGLYGHNERTQLVLQQLRQRLEQPVAAVDPETVRELAQRVQTLRRETVTLEQTEDIEQQPITGIDPTRLPPEYRESIRKYFEELSRQQ